MKKTLSWIPMLLGALVIYGFAEMPPPPAGEPVATSTEIVCASGAEEASSVLHYTFSRCSAEEASVAAWSGFEGSMAKLKGA